MFPIKGVMAQADVVTLPFPDNFSHCVTTSPPYWGLRKYPGEQERIWGGDPHCKHEWKIDHRKMQTGGKSEKQMSNKGVDGSGWDSFSSFCEKCDAWHGALGLEPTPDLFIQHTVEAFREVRRVLRDDGVVWVNLGDSFAGSGGENANTGLQGGHTIITNTEDGTRSGLWRKNPRKTKIAQGNLMLMPHRVAIALQNDGWLLRRDVIWWKRNPMPESPAGWRWVRHRIKVDREDVDWDERPKGWQAGLGGHDSGSDSKGQYRDDEEQTKPVWLDCLGCEKCLHDHPNYPDYYVLKKGSWRHTTAHDYIFMLTKKMHYWSNQEAVRENAPARAMKNPDGWDTGSGAHGTIHRSGRESGKQTGQINSGRNPRSVLDIPQYNLDELWATFVEQMTNPGSVLDVPTTSYKGAHYATYPPNLIAPLIRATCPRWACPVCGQGWSPVVETRNVLHKREPAHQPGNSPTKVDSTGWEPTTGQVKGYRPTCEHPHTIEEALPGWVFDPFFGSGTTGEVARTLGVNFAGIDISYKYLSENARVRAFKGTPPTALDDLPMFAGLEDYDGG